MTLFDLYFILFYIFKFDVNSASDSRGSRAAMCYYKKTSTLKITIEQITLLQYPYSRTDTLHPFAKLKP